MAQGVFRKVDDRTLVAVGVPALEALANVHRGENCIGDIRGARNVEQFNLAWALFQLVAEATDSTKDSVKEWLLRKLNHVDILFLPDGTMSIRAQSIAWHKMEQVKFAAFFQAAIPRIAELLGTAPKDVIARFNDYLDPTARAHFRKVLRHVDAPGLVPEVATETERVE